MDEDRDHSFIGLYPWTYKENLTKAEADAEWKKYRRKQKKATGCIWLPLVPLIGIAGSLWLATQML